ncbi:FAD synthase [Halotydeus destructor]|nr:FAD synthase [Halotydeus destructor]
MTVFDWQSVYKIAESHLHVKTSLEIILQSLESYNYDLKKFAVSFNGGKDCTVLLELVYAVLKSRDKLQPTDRIQTLYFETNDSFPEIDIFVEQSIRRYQLEMLKYPFDGTDWKKVLVMLKSSQEGRNIDAIFMGTRSSDINYPLNPVQRTDADWPSFLRVNPLLHWDYNQIWSFLRELNVPYCTLYDHGYTSLGSRSTTLLNPRLRTVLPNGEVSYKPAYCLDDINAERNGRSK